MVHIPLVIFTKIGITGVSAFGRAKQIDRAVLGFPIPVMVMFLPGVYSIEQALHKLFNFLNVRFYKGDGSTEWFWFPAGCAVFYAGCWYWYGVDMVLEYFTGFSIIDTITEIVNYAV